MENRRHFLKTAGMIAAAGLLTPTNAFATAFPPQGSMLKPAALKSGDTIAITSPAGAVWDIAQVETFSAILKAFGFKVMLGKTLSEKYGYFAGTDELRAAELNNLFADKTIKGIFCMKGGWGCARLLDKLDFELIRKNPKVFIGFSDITTLLIAITAKTGLVTFHGPVGNSGWNAWTTENFKNVVMNTDVPAVFMNPVPAVASKLPVDSLSCIHPGVVSGQLMGGNLTVITSLMGSAYLPDWKGKILFLEEVKEEPYSIDRMLTQLKLCGVLDSINGFVFGKCAKCLAEEPQKAFTFKEVLDQHIKPLGIPAFSGAMIGHIEDKITLPLGIQATIDATAGMIKLNETAVVQQIK